MNRIHIRHLSALTSAPSHRALAQAKIAAIDHSHPLVDSFKRNHDYLRISLTEKCNLRCFYCMPENGIPLTPSADILNDDEVIRLASVFVKAGVTKIRLTGGEPTIRKGIVELTGRLNMLRSQGLRSIAMTSNGLVLHRHLPDLIKNGLTHVNLSLDTLDPFKFEFITRRRGHSAVLKTLELALASPAIEAVKLNIVVVRGLNDGEVLDFLELTKSSRLSVRMIEYMPFQKNGWESKKMVPSSEILETIRSHHGEVIRCSDALNDTARNYKIPGYSGSFGFISSMSDHFCATCNRLRLTSDGQIKVCLFDAKEISLRDELRRGASDAELLSLIQHAVFRKQEKHGGTDDINNIDVVNNRLRRNSSLLVSRPWQSSTPPWIPIRPPAGLRLYSSKATRTLSHLDEHGRANMVDVGDKISTSRTATAQGRIYIPLHAYTLIASTDASFSDDPSLSAAERKVRRKGDVLTISQIAAILASKKTADLIPLCHPLSISKVDVSLKPQTRDGEHSILCEATVKCNGRTGVEMEALTAVSVGLLTVWDMLKAVAGREMQIGDIFVSHKSGGASGDFWREEVPQLKPSYVPHNK